MSKYGDLKIIDIISKIGGDTRKEYEYIRNQTGNLFEQTDHPLTMFGYYTRHLFSVASGKYSIKQFEQSYFPILDNPSYVSSGNISNRTVNYTHPLDLFSLYSSNSNSLNSENAKEVILDCINIINRALSKIRNNITKNAFDSYLKSVESKEINYSKFNPSSNMVDSIIKYVYLLNNTKNAGFKSYPYSIMKLMYGLDGDEYFNKFLAINGIPNIINDIVSKMNSILVAKSGYKPISNIFQLMDRELESDRSKYMSIYNKNWFQNFGKGYTTEDAIDNYYSGILSLFYIKGYLDFTYYKLYDTEHKRVVIGFGSGIDDDKVKQDVAKSKPVIIKKTKPSIIGIFGGDTGTSNLIKSNNYSQEVANMQVTLLVILISPYTNQDKLKSLMVDDDNRFVTEIEKFNNINRDIIEIGKPIKIDSKLNDGIFGFRTERLVELFQTIYKESAIIPEDIRNKVQVNGEYDPQTRKVVDYLVNNYFSGVNTKLSKSEIISTGKNSSLGIFKNKPAEVDLAEIKSVIDSDENLSTEFNKIPKVKQKQNLYLLANASLGLDNESKKIVYNNIIKANQENN